MNFIFEERSLQGLEWAVTAFRSASEPDLSLAPLRVARVKRTFEYSHLAKISIRLVLLPLQNSPLIDLSKIRSSRLVQ